MNPPYPAWLWALALVALLGVALLWWSARGARRWARRRSLHDRLARVGSGETQALEDAFALAREQMQAGGVRLRPRALYGVPWVLFLGDTRSRTADLLHAANPSVKPHGDGRQSFWRWWLMPRLVAIELDARIIELDGTDDNEPTARPLLSSWYHALLTLAERRPALPLDAVVLCVDAQSLLAGPQAAGELAERLRRRADEASQHLRLRLPTQILVTGLDQLPGYALVRDALAEDVLAQAVGFRVPAGTLVIIDDVLQELSDRLRALRMALLRQQTDAAGRLAVHEFFVQWLALQDGLAAFLKRLFAPGTAPAPYRLRGRAVYFVAAPQANRAPAFVAELFGRFLPVERAFPRLR